MISGFDFGTSNCAIGVMNAQSGGVQLLPIENQKAFMPSTLYALAREMVCEHVAQAMPDPILAAEYKSMRHSGLLRAKQARHQHGFTDDEQSLFVGGDAFEEYFAWPGEGYFIKSPKSFLGASGLRAESIHLFEDIITAMMINIKRRGEACLNGQSIAHTVIGRPVNFQGLNAEQSNQQAIAILTVAAKRAGFKSVEFLYEPIAAGLHYEQSLAEDKTVLVVDVGGGTTDCAMVRMGPSHIHNVQRRDDFLGHSGERIGGNDLDIQLAGKQLMPLFGMQSTLKGGGHMPTKVFWDAVSTNDVAAQASFIERQTGNYLEQLLRDCAEPHLIQRFIDLRNNRQNHHVVRSAEQGKIALSANASTFVNLDYLQKELGIDITREQFAQAVERPLSKMTDLMEEAIKQAGCQPELIFVTGGSAQSPVIRQAIAEKLGDIDVVDGDHFGSVVSGLTVFAQRIFA